VRQGCTGLLNSSFFGLPYSPLFTWCPFFPPSQDIPMLTQSSNFSSWFLFFDLICPPPLISFVQVTCYSFCASKAVLQFSILFFQPRPPPPSRSLFPKTPLPASMIFPMDFSYFGFFFLSSLAILASSLESGGTPQRV